MNTNSLKRDISIDLIKVIAIIGVVIIHSCDFSGPIASDNWLYSLLWRTLSGASVPLFLMTSGAVMLDSKKEISLKKLYFKNMLRIFAAMVFWGVLYKLYHLNQTDELTISSALNGVKEVFFFKQEFHFYYIHMILIVYAFLPLTRIFTNHATKEQLQYAIALWIVFAVIYPTATQYYPFNQWSGMTTMWGINLTYASIGYGILGYYLKKYPISPVASVLFIIFGFCSMFALTLYKSVKYDVLYEHFLAGNTFCAFTLGTGMFGIFTGADVKSAKCCSVISWFSKSTFCIYLIHMFVMYTLKDNGITTGFASNVLSIPLYALLILAVCTAFYFVLSKIPFFRKWLI